MAVSDWQYKIRYAFETFRERVASSQDPAQFRRTVILLGVLAVSVLVAGVYWLWPRGGGPPGVVITKESEALTVYLATVQRRFDEINQTAEKENREQPFTAVRLQRVAGEDKKVHVTGFVRAANKPKLEAILSEIPPPPGVTLDLSTLAVR
jgi:hypothetical protein